MKTDKKNKQEIEIPILNNEYKVIVCWGDFKFIKKVVDSWGHIPVEEIGFDDRRGVCYQTVGCHPVIALPHKPRTAQEIGSLSHEAVHAIEDIFMKVQEPLNGEIFAHSVGAIVRTVLKEARK